MSAPEQTEREKTIEAQFLFATAMELGDPGRRAELEAEADRTGRMLVVQPRKSHHEERLDAWAADTSARTVSVDDPKGFLRNLDKIAKGEVRVVPAKQ